VWHVLICNMILLYVLTHYGLNKRVLFLFDSYDDTFDDTLGNFDERIAWILKGY